MDREAFQALAMAGEVPLTADLRAGEAFLTRARAFESRARLTVQPLMAWFPWPTLLTFVGVYAGVTLVALLALRGLLPIWASLLSYPILILFACTHLHDATHRDVCVCSTDFES